MNIVTPAQMEKIDQQTIKEHGLSSLVLMENAARSVLEHIPEGRVGILVGPGNNGGDGLVLARALAEQHRSVQVLLLTEKRSRDAEHNFALAQAWGVPHHTYYQDDDESTCKSFVEKCDVIVDAMFGTGLSRALEGRFKRATELIDQSQAIVLALDIPSGIDGNNGQILGAALSADLTVTFGCLKRGHLLHPGREHCGKVHVTQPGFHPDAMSKFSHIQLMDQAQAAGKLPQTWPQMHKGDNGRLLMLTGSERYPGAGILSTLGALNAGAGLVTHSWPEKLNSALLNWAPEAMPTPRHHAPDWTGFHAVVAGSGLGEEARELCGQLLSECMLPKVIDADALSYIVDAPKAVRSNMIITPHPGELGRLLDRSSRELEEDRIETALEAARLFECVVCFKGFPTVCAAPNGRAYLNSTGNPTLSQGGTGDVLAGIIGAYLAYGLPPLEASACGVYIHRAAADLALETMGPRGVTAHRIAELVPFAYSRIVGNP